MVSNGKTLIGLAALLISLCLAPFARAEDGYDLWLRYRPIEAEASDAYRAAATEIVAPASSASLTIAAARDELKRGLGGLLSATPPVSDAVTKGGALLLGTPKTSSLIAGQRLDLKSLGDEGFLIRSATVNGKAATLIAANTDIGVLYGSFAYLRLIQTRQSVAQLNVSSSPRLKLRTLNHWDNLDGSIERGYSGRSIFDWHRLPDWVDPRIVDYARANASIGINGAVLNNVNANAVSLTPEYLHKAAAIATTLRPYGIKVYLTARFSAPIEIGGLKTADPRDPAVQAWWKAKADEIYSIIPDFGGFLVKANSEGQPGPGDYHRTHAEGANMLADALAPHNGVVMWRAFVYAAENPIDRAMQAYNEFVPTDGQFRDNVVIQTKNGPIDFQPREPFSPLFGAMKRTAVSLELQITKEYLGLSTSMAYLGPLYEEALQADTMVRGKGSTVARVIDGSLFHQRLTAMAGVANIGSDRNWSGSSFNQANWYVFGRMAWDHQLSARAIAEEWVRMTFSNDANFVTPTVAMMMGSREAVVKYMTPLGLAHLMATSHHYGPGPWVHDLKRPEWNPVYYHRADAKGIGFDRSKSGSNAVSQYAPPLAKKFNDVSTTPEEYLLWFHHVPWDHHMASGKTLWDELVLNYTDGVSRVSNMRRAWAGLRSYVDPERYSQTETFLSIEEREAQWWRDASITYFQSISNRPLPAGVAPPAHPLAYYEGIHSRYVPGIQ